MRKSVKTYPALEPLAERVLPRLVKLRRHIHEHPELALREYETSALVKKVLSETNVHICEPILETDVVAILNREHSERNVTLRADMDALPLEEKSDLSYASKNNGIMHACGHDGHTAMLLGAALVLDEIRDFLPGSVRFVFQPGEEVAAAGRELVAGGMLESPRPDGIVALHSWPGIKAGCFASCPGAMMAAADFFRVTVKGKGGHGSKPDQAVNPITAAARIVESFNGLSTTEASPFDPVVISICHFEGGRNSNVIPETARIEGTIRYFSQDVRDRIVTSMKRAAKGVCDASGATHHFIHETPYLPTFNDEKVVSLGKEAACNLFGESMWADVEQPSMGAEDFSYYLSGRSGAMFWIGMGETSAPLHTSYFDFNDDVLKKGVLFLCATAMRLLEAVAE